MIYHTVPAQKSNISKKNHCGEVLNFFLSDYHQTILTFCQVIILLYTMYQAHRLLTTGPQTHKVVHTSLVLASRIYTSPYH